MGNHVSFFVDQEVTAQTIDSWFDKQAARGAAAGIEWRNTTRQAPKGLARITWSEPGSPSSGRVHRPQPSHSTKSATATTGATMIARPSREPPDVRIVGIAMGAFAHRMS